VFPLRVCRRTAALLTLRLACLLWSISWRVRGEGMDSGVEKGVQARVWLLVLCRVLLWLRAFGGKGGYLLAGECACMVMVSAHVCVLPAHTCLV
jgi:hypothetical protein